MIWTAITYSTANEKVECQVFEGPMDFNKAYGTISHLKQMVLFYLLLKAIIKEAAYIPQIDLKVNPSTISGRILIFFF